MKQKPNQKNSNPFPLGLIGGVALALLAVGGVSAWWAFQQLKTDSPISNPSPTAQPTQPFPTPSLPEERVQIYWLKVTDKETVLLPSFVKIQQSEDRAKILEAALQDLLAGPKNSAYTTTIPEGTKLLGIKLDKEGVHVNLSQEFTTGGGSESMIGRLRQIIYTATTLEANAKVWIDVEGKPLEVLGGEGVIVDQPMTRQNLQENF
jgi:spore germination protein GerM